MATGPTERALFDELDRDDEFNPLEDSLSDYEDDDEVFDILATTAKPPTESAVEIQPKADIRTDAEKIADLFKAMAPRRKVLMGILAFCTEKQLVPAVEAEVDELQKNNFSVYTAANYCTLLEQAGAIRRISEDGTDYANVTVEPVVVEEDGVEYLKPGTPPESFWVTTEEGCKYLEADKPAQRLRELFENEPIYHPIYKHILLLCSDEAGKTTRELGEAVDDDPILQDPRLYVQRFIDRLEKCDALIWEKTWKTTDIGLLGIEELEKAADDEASPESEAEGNT